MALMIVWVELPAKDINRAAKFYGALFGKDLEINDEGVRRTAIIYYDENATGLSLTETANFEPSDHGIWIYLDAQGDLDEMAKKAEQLGGTITGPKTSMGEAGNYITVKDTEGNIVALWSM